MKSTDPFLSRLILFRPLMDWHSLVLPSDISPDEQLMTPREVANLFGVRTTTVARWSREGRLKATWTPGGHRRYLRGDVVQLNRGTGAEQVDPQQERLEQDMVRLYSQGWSIRRVADVFEVNYSTMRRILLRHTTLRRQGR
jgi:excisionase family DNA binding protein